MRKGRYRHVFLAAGLWLTSWLSWGQAPDVVMVLSKNEGVYRQLAEMSAKALPGVKTQVVSAGQWSPTDADGQSAPIVVTIGTAAAKKAYRHTDAPTVSALLSASAFAQLRPEANSNETIIPILLDQPVQRYLALGKALVPQARSAGVLLGPLQQSNREQIASAAREMNLSVQFADITEHSNPIKVIGPVLGDTDFFIVLADQKSINQAAAKWVLQLSYRYRKPVIAFSKKYAQAGALAAVYSAPEDIAAQIVRAIKRLRNASGGEPGALYSIEINRNVARSLGIAVRRPEAYKAAIESAGDNKIKEETP